jgi:hypothetical protein
LFESHHGAGHDRRYYIANYIEVLARLIVSKQDLELGAGLLCIGDRARLVGFELRKLQIEALEVEFGEVSGLQAFAGDLKLVLEIAQVVVGELLRCFGDYEAGESLADGENGLLFLRVVLGIGLGGRGMGTVETPATLFATLEEA